MEEYNVVYQREAIEFVTVAKEFVSFLENARDFSKDDFVDHAVKILPLLYLKGTLLPEIEDCDESFSEKFVDEAAWSYIQQVTSSKLEDDDDFIQIGRAHV